MKKYIKWLFAAIFICGASIVMSSCSKDDDDNKGNETIPNTYEVDIFAVLPECTAGLFTLNIEYTDANGKNSTATVKAGDKSDELNAELKSQYKKSKDFLVNLMEFNDEKAQTFDKLIVKNIKLTVPAGKSFSYKVTMKARTDYVTPSEDGFYFVVPFASPYYTRISGNQDFVGVNEELNLRVGGPVETSNVADFIQIYDGKVISEGSKTMH